MGELADILTMQEVSWYWNKHRSTIRYHVDRGTLKARYSRGGPTLIDRASVEALWGPPVREDEA